MNAMNSVKLSWSKPSVRSILPTEELKAEIFRQTEERKRPSARGALPG